MTNILIALGLGVVAGAIDTIPMALQKINKFSVLAVFTQWVLVGLLIPFIDWNIYPWLKGLIVGELGMVPFMIIAILRNKKSIIPTAIFAAFLGVAIGVAGDLLIV